LASPSYSRLVLPFSAKLHTNDGYKCILIWYDSIKKVLIDLKKTIVALSLGLIFGSTGTAIAAATDTVQAAFAKYNFVINGENKQPPPIR
jgi:hypothetical protein